MARATALLAVAAGADYQTAAQTAGRKSGDAVSHLVARFNREALRSGLHLPADAHVVPANITLVPLPPRSPELNPMENL